MKWLRSYFTLRGITPAVAIIQANRVPLGFGSIAAATLATAQKLTLTGQANYAVIQCEGTSASTVRYRDDGTAPTANSGSGVGMLLVGGQEMHYFGDLSAIQFIADAGSPILNYSLYA